MSAGMKRVLSFLLLALLLISGAAEARHVRGSASAGGGGGGETTILNILANGWGSFTGSINTTPTASITSGKCFVTAAAQSPHQSGSCWFTTLVNVTAGFHVHYTTVQTSGATGMGFAVQNTTAATNPAGQFGPNFHGDANGGGAAVLDNQNTQMHNSVFVQSDMSASNGNSAYNGINSTIGIFLNGGPAMGHPNSYCSAALAPLAPGGCPTGPPYGYSFINFAPAAGINALNGDLLDWDVIYDTTLLDVTVTDATNGKALRFYAPVDVAGNLTSSTGYFGFAGGDSTAHDQTANSFFIATGFNTRVATPTFTVAPGQYSSTQTVGINVPAGSTCYYTTNGLPPTPLATVYSAALTISSNTVLQAACTKTNFSPSLIASGNYQIATSGTPQINFPSGFASSAGLLIPTGYAQLSGSNYILTNIADSTPETGALWYPTPLNVATSFTEVVDFSLSAQGSPGTRCCGMGIVWQGVQPSSSSTGGQGGNNGPLVIGNGGTGLGYVGLKESAAVTFDYLPDSSGNHINYVTNGTDPGTSPLTMSGPQINSGHKMRATLVYNDTAKTLQVTLLDTVNSSTYGPHTFTADIPTAVGASSAIIGIVGSTQGGPPTTVTIYAMTYLTP